MAEVAERNNDSCQEYKELWNRLGIFVINLDQATERIERITRDFSIAGIPITRVAAIHGKRVDEHDFNELSVSLCKWRLRFHLRRDITPNEVGCYLSHIKALKIFLASQKEYALICEDDVSPGYEAKAVLNELLTLSDCWDLIRLFHYSHQTVPFQTLKGGYQLSTAIQGMTSAACYLINRKGAETFLAKTRKIQWLFDTALCQGWIGIREMVIVPPLFPINENSLTSTIEYKNRKKYSRCLIPIRQTCKLILHLRRYGIQLFRILRLQLFYREKSKKKRSFFDS
ncbi:MAG: glycosyltransferase family 25 protein [Planctomycetia bacterium]|nr:glycosyltransferase family 25 protein [Planctomycetia bacterium]